MLRPVKRRRLALFTIQLICPTTCASAMMASGCTRAISRAIPPRMAAFRLPHAFAELLFSNVSVGTPVDVVP